MAIEGFSLISKVTNDHDEKRHELCWSKCLKKIKMHVFVKVQTESMSFVKSNLLALSPKNWSNF